jgi:hypothetical protein
LSSNYYEVFLNSKFPGLRKSDDIHGLLTLLKTSNVEGSLQLMAAQVNLIYVYNACRFEIDLYLTALEQARQFIDVCGI